MCEVWDEATYVKHHKKKIAFLFSAMRHFAQSLEQAHYQVDYIQLEARGNTKSFYGELARAIKRHNVKNVVVTFPGEYRVMEDMQQWQAKFGVNVDIRPDTRFICQPDEFASWAKGRKQLRMEYFYREMRKKTGVLMEDDHPVGGKWNYDTDNRSPPKKGLDVPATSHASRDDITNDVIELVSKRFADHFGDLEPFHYAVTRRGALHALKKFIAERLPLFGTYQDAMIEGEPWMYHSHIALYLNCGLLEPLECLEAAENAYLEEQAPINAVEGFIRQILGWREYVRGLYWLKMPDYASCNHLNAKRPLPDFYWSGDTKLNCLRQCIHETKTNAYAHHIQRLMVLGNFALLAGIDPRYVNEWYLIVYADAYEWVELPNVSGMVLFADGGVLASKPYAASGAYINKMSNYCKNCEYNVKEKTSDNACPFNSLYWDFLIRNEAKLKGNNRMAMMYQHVKRMSHEQKKAVQAKAKQVLNSL